MSIPKLSTGKDSTLGEWRDLTAAVFGEDSAATKFWDEKIAACENGRGEPVLTDERQMLYVISQVHERGY